MITVDESIIEAMAREIQELKAKIEYLNTDKRLFRVQNLYVNPTTITANQNDYDVGYYDVVYLRSDASRNITGITNGITGRRLTIINYGANNLVFVHSSGSSMAGNRLFCPGSANSTITPGRSLDLIFTTAWRVMPFST